MRILHLSMLYPPHAIGGAERSVAALAEAQVALGHEVYVVCTTPHGLIQEIRNGVNVTRIPHGTLFWAEDGAKHRRIEAEWRKAAMPFNRVQRKHFAQILKSVQPDIVHSHSMVDVATGIWQDSAKAGYKVVHTLRDYDLLCVDSSMYHEGNGCGPKCKILSLAKQHHSRSLSGVVAISRETLAIHRQHGLFARLPADRTRVIWNSATVAGIGADYRRPDRTGQPFTFGYLGRVTEAKGVNLLIDAAKTLPQDNSWQMIIAGDGQPNLERFRAAASGLPISLPGFIAPRNFFEQIDVLVVPSIWAEPFGRIVIEAYHMGVPVLGSAIGGIPDLIVGDQDQWLFPAGNATALAKRLQILLAAGRAALPLPATFAGRLQETAPQTIAGQYIDYYNSLAE
ncbi:glycosyltransferase family 4 protein [Novosphingobium sp. FKTRR1]|uniref:glycosyltransferase family 4 protein n=1 Tax=Novosphingobium sp. FKTRR1 TaxID=2879118 RepID=UPI001CEFCEB6|nr:glycosyltransferase family 4 protein [Novosphingobium sp. FKTRR1]